MNEDHKTSTQIADRVLLPLSKTVNRTRSVHAVELEFLIVLALISLTGAGVGHAG